MRGLEGGSLLPSLCCVSPVSTASTESKVTCLATSQRLHGSTERPMSICPQYRGVKNTAFAAFPDLETGRIPSNVAKSIWNQTLNPNLLNALIRSTVPARSSS